MRLIQRTFTVLAILVGIAQAGAQAQTPRSTDEAFGLRLGLSVARVKAMGVRLEAVNELNGKFDVYKTESLPKGLMETDIYVLRFCAGELCQIEAFGTKFSESEQSFTSRVQRYEELRARVAKRFGPPKSTDDDRDTPTKCTCKDCAALGAIFDRGSVAAKVLLWCEGDSVSIFAAITDKERVERAGSKIKGTIQQLQKQIEKLEKKKRQDDKEAF